jgi:NADH-quinone oxidoreductase subunit L
VLVEPGQALTRSLVYVDRTAIDGTVSSVGRVTVGLGEIARRVQSGYVRSYAASMLLGLVVLVVAVLVFQI